MQKKDATLSIEGVRDFAVDAPNLLIIACDPDTDMLFVSHNGKASVGTFGGDIVKRALDVEKFGGVHKKLSATILEATAKLLNATLDSIEALNKLSTKKKTHAKRTKSTRGSSNS